MINVKNFFSLESYSHPALFQDCIYPWLALANLKKYLTQLKLGKIECSIPSGVTLVHPELITIGQGTVVESGAYLIGPCVIGENCQIRQGAYIRENVLTGNGCVIGHASEIKGSILLDRASIPHFNYVGDSILGNDVNLGAGVICTNLRLDNQNVTLLFEGKKFDTSLKKLGAIVGDGSKIGAHCVLNPGTVIGKNVFCHPLLKLTGYILPNSIIRTSVQI